MKKNIEARKHEFEIWYTFNDVKWRDFKPIFFGQYSITKQLINFACRRWKYFFFSLATIRDRKPFNLANSIETYFIFDMDLFVNKRNNAQNKNILLILHVER